MDIRKHTGEELDRASNREGLKALAFLGGLAAGVYGVAKTQGIAEVVSFVGGVGSLIGTSVFYEKSTRLKTAANVAYSNEAARISEAEEKSRELQRLTQEFDEGIDNFLEKIQSGK